jgi:hypothetical protein
MNAETQFKRLYPNRERIPNLATWFNALRELVQVRTMLARHEVAVSYCDEQFAIALTGYVERIGKYEYVINNDNVYLRFDVRAMRIKGGRLLIEYAKETQ